MGRFVARLLGFAVVAGVVYVVLIILAARWLPMWARPNVQYRPGWIGHSMTRFQELQNTKKVDVLILGSSHAYSNFDVRTFSNQLNLSTSNDSIRLFNMGSSSQTHIQTEILLERYLPQLKPKIILYEVYPYTLTADGLESTLDIVSNHPVEPLTTELALRNLGPTSINTWLCASVRDKIGMNSNLSEPLTRNGDTYIPGGFVKRKMRTYTDTVFGKFDWELRKDQVDAFKRNIELLNKSKAELFLVYAPVTDALYESVRNHDHTDSLFRSQGRYIDMNDMEVLDDSLHFYDHHHLNQEGVRLFNRALIDTLNQKYLSQ